MKTREIVEKSMGKGKVQELDIFKRASTYFFHDFPINKKDKLGTRWTKKPSIYAGFTLRRPCEQPIALCLLSGRPPVQLRPGTPVFFNAFTQYLVIFDLPLRGFPMDFPIVHLCLPLLFFALHVIKAVLSSLGCRSP